MSEPMVKIQHVRQLGMCVRGAKAWCELHGIDFAEFLQRGIPVSRVEALNDTLGNRSAQFARDEVEKGQQ